MCSGEKSSTLAPTQYITISDPSRRIHQPTDEVVKSRQDDRRKVDLGFNRLAALVTAHHATFDSPP